MPDDRKGSDRIRKRVVAAAQALLLGPAILFMVSLFLRWLARLDLARRVVDWYAGRAWTLWLLLVLLPLAALALGCAALLGDKHLLDRIYASDAELAWSRNRPQEADRLLISPAVWFIAAETLTAGIILAVVGAHVLMN